MVSRTYGLVALYLIAIVCANLLVAAFGPAITILNAFLFIGLDITSRDALHETWHKRHLLRNMALLIASGSLLSYLIDGAAGPIAMASFLAFAVSATLDTLVYGMLARHGWSIKVNGSNVVSAAADSLIFPTLAFGALLPWIVLGQFAAKVAGGALWSLILRPREGTQTAEAVS